MTSTNPDKTGHSVGFPSCKGTTSRTMERHTTTSRAEAERLLGIAEKLLRSKDFSGCRDFAILAQETEPLLEGSDQILAVAEVLLAAEGKRLKANQHDWYSILQIPQRTDELELMKKQYRRLALLLHPDKNKFPFSDSAFRLVADSWAVLSDPAKKSAFDNEFASRFTKVDLVSGKKQQHQHQHQPRQQKKTTPQQGDDGSGHKLPVRRSGRAAGASPGGSSAGIESTRRNSGGNPGWIGNFWTACPYCYNLFEYPRAYEGCCLRCDNHNCKRAFTATEIRSLPPQVPGKDAYYCCWGFFPMGFVAGNSDGKNKNKFPKWMPPIFGGNATPGAAGPPPVAAANVTPISVAHANATPISAANANATPISTANANATPISAANAMPMSSGDPSMKRKRGRPRKYFH